MASTLVVMGVTDRHGAPDLRIGSPDAGCAFELTGLGVAERYRLADGSLAPFGEIFATVSLTAQDGRSWEFDERGNGFEPLAVAQFRSDLRQLVARREGSVAFTSHDRSLVNLVYLDQEIVGLEANSSSLPLAATDDSEPAWEQPRTVFLGTVTFDDLLQGADQIDAIEDAFGALEGHCMACGVPGSLYYR